MTLDSKLSLRGPFPGRAGRCLFGRCLFAAIAALAAPAFAAAEAPASERSNASVLQMCNGPYALCDAAACTPIPEQKTPAGPSEPNPSHALCECAVENGPNLGPGPCSNRTPQGAKGQYILSTYSFAFAKKAYLTCPAGGERTVCFGYPCVIDEHHPTRAHCTCPIKYNSELFWTQGGDCKAAACSNHLWQGGTPAEYALINSIFHKATGQPPPPPCGAGGKSAKPATKPHQE